MNERVSEWIMILNGLSKAAVIACHSQALSRHYVNGIRTTTKNLIRSVGFPAEIRN